MVITQTLGRQLSILLKNSKCIYPFTNQYNGEEFILQSICTSVQKCARKDAWCSIQQNSFSGSNSKVLKKGGQSRETKPGAAKWAAAGPSVHAGGHGRLFGLRSFQPWPQAVLQRKQASWRKLCTKLRRQRDPRRSQEPRDAGLQ